MLWNASQYSPVNMWMCYLPGWLIKPLPHTGSYDRLGFGQGATDRQCMLPSTVAVVYAAIGLWRLVVRVVARSPTIGEDRWQDKSYVIVRLVVAISDQSYGNGCVRRPIVRSIVVSCDWPYDQSWRPATDHMIGRDILRPITRPIVASATDRTIGRTTSRKVVRQMGTGRE